jgi:predicted lipoprotein with Yx(FWY)xxD motif
MSIRRSLALLAVPAAALALTATPALASTAASTAHHAAPSGTKIIVADTAFGRSLAVGSGPFKNFTLYYISSDHGRSYGCTTGATSTPVGPITCTGPSNDQNAEWPAITTNGRPVAGPGVSRALLGRVFRKGVGWQVTYAGHPLYLFDRQSGSVTGEGWFEPGLPPWHGIWWLMSPGGQPVPWAGTLTTARVGGQTVLAEPFMTGIGWVKFPVYTFSGDLGSYTSSCTAISACARVWPPLYTNGSPGYSGVPGSGVGVTSLPSGLSQTTWNGRPLYLFSNEALAPTSNGGAVPVGNGNGIKAFGGTFSLVVSP